MRVLHFYKTYFPDTMGGIEQVICQLARGGAALDVETEVLSLSADKSCPTIEMDSHRSHRAKLDFQLASTGFSVSAFRRFAELAKGADIIHYHFPWPFMDLVHFAVQPARPTVVTYHSDIIRQRYLLRLYRPLQQRFLSSVDHIVATSPNYVATSDVLGGFSEKLSVIPIGLDQATYPRPDADRLSYWRNRCGKKFFLFVGVLRYYKGLHILLEAAQGTGYPIVIVGAGPIESELKTQAERLGLTNVHFMGQLPEVDKVALLQLCHGVVFPSHLRSEAFGVTLLEGAMFAKPMISSEIGTGTSYINVDGETGLVVPRSDPAAFRDAMRKLWNDPAMAAEMGRRAQARFRELFTADKMTAAYVHLYRRLLVAAPQMRSPSARQLIQHR
jgi:rhamnosyl/mannosyltransferase